MHEQDENPTLTAGQRWSLRTPARVVVAEDNDDLRELIMTKLLDDGYEVYGASSASELLHMLAVAGCTIPPFDGADLIVVDQYLPDLSGIEIIRRMRIAHSRIPFVLMTAYPAGDLLREAKRLQVPLLVKPFSLSELSHMALLIMLMGDSLRDDERPLTTH